MFSWFPDIKFNRNQRIGILFLLGIIFTLQIFIFYLNSASSADNFSKGDIPKDLVKQYDSLKQIRQQQKKIKIYPFNPNYLTDNKAYFLGIDLKILNKIKAYRQQGKYFHSKEDFKKISGISDSLYNILEPYIDIPSFTNHKTFSKLHKISSRNINKATAQDLTVIKGIGEVLSDRIIKYRNSIGGFKDKSQLNKVYGLEKDVINKIWNVFYLPENDISKISIIKKPINTANVEELKKVYGIGDKLAERIINYRNKLGGFSIKEQLNEVYGLKPEVIQELWRYFEIKHPKKILNKIDLNEANIKDLAKNPYIDYQLAKKIISYRTLHSGFNSVEELKNIPEFPKKKFKVISLYLKIEP